jgi:eukaryotic-like serine/threonine-protein kinase
VLSREAKLDRVGPGSVLGRRYALNRRLGDRGLTSTWQAHDGVLDRRVFLREVSRQHPYCHAVLDAARQAASVEDPRLTRILDVGDGDGSIFVVNEWLETRSLAEELRVGPMNAEDARTVVGEVALALEAARHRGLHHLRLTPSHVHRLDDASVRVTELAIAAALDGVDLSPARLPGDMATAVDSRDLVALAYASLTGTWPLSAQDSGYDDLPRAPRISGRPASPAQLVAGAPADLDALCSQAFGGAGPPDNPGEIARQIAPWGRDRRDAGSVPPFATAVLPTVPPRAPITAPTPAVYTGPTTPVPGGAATPGGPHGAGYPFEAVPPQTSPGSAGGAAGPFGLGGESGNHGDPVPDDRSPWHGQWAVGDDVVPNPRMASPQQTRTVILSIGGFVAVFLLLAYFGLRGLGDKSFIQRDRVAASATGAAKPTDPTTTADPTPKPAGGEPIRISSGRGFDPEGDGSEKDADAEQAFDGDPSSTWTSDTYNSVAFGGLKKGVGLYLDLGGAKTVAKVKVAGVPGGTALEVRTADGDRLGPDVLATGSGTGQDLELTLASSVETDNVVLWFTTPASVDGGFRVEVAEVEVS